MEGKTKDGIFDIINGAWKKDVSIFIVILIWSATIITYILNIKPQNGKTLMESIDSLKMLLCSIIPVLLLVFIIYKRTHLPRIHGRSIGILFCVSCFDDKQIENLRNKFINPFRAMINNSDCFEYEVVLLDEYLANKYSKKLQITSKSEKITAKLLKKTNCKVLIFGSCVTCAEAEKNSCILNFPSGISYDLLKANDNNIMKSHLKEIFSPLKNIDISKLNETMDFDKKAVELGFIFKYILALSNLICTNVDIAIKDLNDLRKSFDKYHVSSQVIMRIKRNYNEILGVCYAVKANTEYEKFVETREIACLEKAREYMSHPEVDETHFSKNIFMTICVFKLDRDVEKALGYARQCNMKDPLAKINKAFLKLYKECNVTNLKNAYWAYKDMRKLTEEKVCELEIFIVEEYNIDSAKWQLLFLLTIIYLYQENVMLAKDYFERFCGYAGTLLKSKLIEDIINSIKRELSDVDMQNYHSQVN